MLVLRCLSFDLVLCGLYGIEDDNFFEDGATVVDSDEPAVEYPLVVVVVSDSKVPDVDSFKTSIHFDGCKNE